jgi:hypothetical protein
MFQTSGGKNRKSVDDPAQAPAQNQALKIRNNCLPFVVVGIWEMFEREFARNETIIW